MNLPYRRLVGLLQHVAVSTRPDIAHTVSALARYGEYAGPQHFKRALHLVNYLKETRDKEIHIVPRDPKDLRLVTYTDADWAKDEIDRSSITGMVTFCAGVPVSWKAKNQSKSATSTCEAEYVAAWTGCRSILELRSVMQELGIPQQQPTPLLCDSSSAIMIATGQGINSNIRHVDTAFHRIRQEINDNNVRMKKVLGEENIADVFTKSLTQQPFEKLTKQLWGNSWENANWSHIQAGEDPSGSEPIAFTWAAIDFISDMPTSA